jgi:hypothetical protein
MGATPRWASMIGKARLPFPASEEFGKAPIRGKAAIWWGDYARGCSAEREGKPWSEDGFHVPPIRASATPTPPHKKYHPHYRPRLGPHHPDKITLVTGAPDSAPDVSSRPQSHHPDFGVRQAPRKSLHPPNRPRSGARVDGEEGWECDIFTWRDHMLSKTLASP